MALDDGKPARTPPVWPSCAAKPRPCSASRAASRPGANVTQMHYARRALSRPRWNTSRCAKTASAWVDGRTAGDRSVSASARQPMGATIPETITPEFVRDEVARGRHHPGQHQSPGGGADDHRPQLPVKINANIGNSAVTSSIEEEEEKSWSGPSAGGRHRDGSAPARTSTPRATGSCCNSPVPIGTVPIYQALERWAASPRPRPGKSSATR